MGNVFFDLVNALLRFWNNLLRSIVRMYID